MVIYEHKKTHEIYATVGLELYKLEGQRVTRYGDAVSTEEMRKVFPFEWFRKRKPTQDERLAMRAFKGGE